MSPSKVNFFAFLIYGCLALAAHAGDSEINLVERTPLMEIVKLDSFRGQFLSVLFVEASNSPLSFDPYRNLNLDVRSLKAKSIQIKIDRNEVRIPSVEIQKRPFKYPYNFVIFVISANEDFSWMNSDGSRPLPLEWQTRNTNKNAFRAFPRTALIDESMPQNSVLRFSITD